MAPHPWARLAVDTDESWAQFSEWLHETPRRSVWDWAVACSDRGNGESIPILAWAQDHLWEERAQAYDEWQANEPYRKAFPVLSPIILTMLRMAHREIAKWEAAQMRAGDAPGFLSWDQIARLMRDMARLEQGARALAALEKKEQSSGSALYDFSKLSLDEMRQFNELASKMMV